MKGKRQSRSVAMLLTAAMLVQLMATPAFAAAEETAEGVFRFSATEYAGSEAQGGYDVTVERVGDVDFAADVVFKAIDVGAEYGVDYRVLDEGGQPLEVTEGLVAEPALAAEPTPSAEQTTEPEEQAVPKVDTPEEETPPEESAPPAPIQDISTALDARAALLGAEPESPLSQEERDTAQEQVSKTLETLYEGLEEAAGAVGTVHFEPGETEQTFTVEIIDNERPQADRVVLLALMAASRGGLVPNATAVLSIRDDEDYEMPVIGVKTPSVTADPATGTAAVTLERTAGVDYYTSVFASTWSRSAQADLDFVPLEGIQIAFLPGETEKTVTVQVKDFSQEAVFGLRIDPNETCGVAAGADRAEITILGAAANTMNLMSVTAPIDDEEVAIGDPIAFTLDESAWTTHYRTWGSHEAYNGTTQSLANLYTTNSQLYKTWNSYWATAGEEKLSEWTERGVFAELPEHGAYLQKVAIKGSAIGLSQLCDGYDALGPISNTLGAVYNRPSWYPVHAKVYIEGDDVIIENSASFGDRYFHPKDYEDMDRYRQNPDLRVEAYGSYDTDYIFSWKKPLRLGDIVGYYIKSNLKYETSSTVYRDVIYNLTEGNLSIMKVENDPNYEYTPDPLYLYNESGEIADAFYLGPNTKLEVNFGADPESPAARRGITPQSVNFRELYHGYTLQLYNPLNSSEGPTNGKVSVLARDAVAGRDIKYQGDETILATVYDRIYVAVQFQDTKEATFAYQGKVNLHPNDEIRIRAIPTTATMAVKGFRLVPVYTSSQGLYYDYDHSMDIPCIDGGTASFRVPTPYYMFADRSGVPYFEEARAHDSAVHLLHFEITPYTDDAHTTVEPAFVDLNNDGKNDYALPSGMTDWTGAVMVQPVLNGTAEDESGAQQDVQATDAAGRLELNTTPNQPVLLRANCPKGYTAVWWDMTGDLNHDGVITNDEVNASNLNGSGQRYFEVSGAVYASTAWNEDTQITYAFVPVGENEMAQGTRVGQVLVDSRSFLDIVKSNLTSAPKWKVLPGVGVSIGAASATSDSSGRFTLKMDEAQVKSRGNVSPVVSLNDGAGNRTIYVGNITPEQFHCDLRIPAYDTYIPKKLSVRYAGEGEAATTVLAVKDKLLTVQASVAVPEGANGLLLGADFFLTDEAGNTLPGIGDLTALQNASETRTKLIAAYGAGWDELSLTKQGSYLIENGDLDFYTGFDKNTRTAVLMVNPTAVGIGDGSRIALRYGDDVRSYRKMDLGYSFIKAPDMGTFLLGAIGQTSTSADLDLLGQPFLNFNMGELSGFSEQTGAIYGKEYLDGENKTRDEFPAILYSFGKGFDFSNDSTFTAFWDRGTEFETKKKDAPKNPTAGESSGGSTENNETQNTTSISQGENGVTPTPGKNEKQTGATAGMGEGEGESTPSRVSTRYNYSIQPSVGFQMMLTRRPYTDEAGNTTYKNCFESLNLHLTLDFHYDMLITIDLVPGIAIEIAPGLDINMAAIYVMKSKYDSAEHLTPVIEYGGENSQFSIFGTDTLDANTTKEGYLGIDPSLYIAAKLKILVVRVDVKATFSFDMDFYFSSDSPNREYGNMRYTTQFIVELFSFELVNKPIHSPVNVHLFGENSPIPEPEGAEFSNRPDPIGEEKSAGRSQASAFSPQETDAERSPQQALNAALSDAVAESYVTQSDRSYLDERSTWMGQSRMLRSAQETAAGETARKLLQEGVSSYGAMASVQFADEGILAAYIDDVPGRANVNRYGLYYTYTTDGGMSWSTPALADDDGTLDDYPALCLLDDGDVLLTWSSADTVLDGSATLNDALKAMNIKAAVFDTAGKTIGDAMEVTRTTQDDTSADTDPTPAPFDMDGKTVYRVYYLKADYPAMGIKSADALEGIAATKSVIAYRDYDTHTRQWSQEYTVEQQLALEQRGVDVESYTRQWYGQQFVDTRLDGQTYNYITEIAAGNTGGISYLAYVVDWDGNTSTTTDRDVFLLCNDHLGEQEEGTEDALLPVRVTDVSGAYSGLEFGDGDGAAMVFFHSDQFTAYDADGAAQRAGGLSFADAAHIFQSGDPGDPTAARLETSASGGYRQLVVPLGTYDENGNWTAGGYVEPLKPGEAVSAPYNDYAVCTDNTGRFYLVWNQPDAETGVMQLYAATYNLAPEGDTGASIAVVGWCDPVCLTAPEDGDYEDFTVRMTYDEALGGGHLALLAKQPGESGADLVALNHTPGAKPTMDRIGMNSDYLYDDSTVGFSAFLTNLGLAAEKTMKTEIPEVMGGGFYLAPVTGTYVTEFWKNVGGARERIGVHLWSGAWNPTQTILADCEYQQVGTVPDNMTIEVKAYDATGTGWTKSEEVEDCSALPLLAENKLVIEKRPEVYSETLTLTPENSREVNVYFDVRNIGNLPAEVTAVVSAVKGEETRELERTSIGTLGALLTTDQMIRVAVPEDLQTPDVEQPDSLSSFDIRVDLYCGGKQVSTNTAQGSFWYNALASELLKNVQEVTLEQDDLSLPVGEVSRLNAALTEHGGESSSIRLVSSDESVLAVAGNMIQGKKAGTVTLTAYAEPNVAVTVFNSKGVGEAGWVLDEVPQSLLKSDSITVTVYGSGGGSSGTPEAPQTGAPVELKPSAIAGADGSATAAVTEKELLAAADKAARQGADAIVVEPQLKGEAEKVSVELPASALAGLPDKTKADLTIKTPAAAVTIPNGGLSELAGAGAKQVTITTEKLENGDVAVTVLRDGERVQNLSTGIRVELPAAAPTPGTVLVQVGADGTETVVKNSAITENGIRGTLDGSATLRVKDNTKTFTDVVEGTWYTDAVTFVTARELFQGTGSNTFSPDGDMTRAMFFTVLARLDGQDTAGGGTWYSKAMDWAKTAGISDGTNPDGGISREQLATMLYRYAGSPAVPNLLLDFTDAGELSDYADSAMRWAVSEGIVTGKGGGLLDPKGQATRAQVAAMLMRYLQA